MKSISLKDVSKIFVKCNNDDYENFKRHENEYKQMWTYQTSEFWVKYVISIRKHVKATSSKYNDKCEKELIAFLKCLTHKNFIETNNYVKNANSCSAEYDQIIHNLKLKFDTLIETEREETFSQLRVIALKLRCAGSFVNILSLYQTAIPGNEFGYSPPEAWFTPVLNVEPFETFLRSKWGGFKNIEDILGCRKEEIKWWKSPAQKQDHSSAAEQVTSPTADDLIINFNPPEDYQLQGLEITDKNPEENQTLSWQTRCWFPVQTTHWQIFEENAFKNKHMDYIWKQNPLFKLWPLLEHAFPPILHDKFHRMNAEKLIDGDPVKYNLAVATWFIQYVESFGNRYLNFIQLSRDNLASRSSIPDPAIRKRMLDEWSAIRDCDKQVLETILNKSGAPNVMQHSAVDPEDFLVDPFILIQLPWQPVLFRQWLAVALIEILKLELEAVELRHWPLPKQLEPIARDLLSRVGDAKERILFGWSVLSFEATTYPKTDKKHPTFIIDQVILPSYNMLAFLCSGNASVIIHSIKKLAWSSISPIDDRINIPKPAYSINEVLNGFNVLFFGHYTFWKQYNTIRDPFPTVQLTQDLGLEAQLQQIQNGKVQVLPPEDVPFYLQALSVDEERIITILQNAAEKVPEDYTITENLIKTHTVLQEVVIKCGHFSEEKLKTLIPMLRTNVAKIAGTNIFDNLEEEKSPLQQLILSSVVYHDVNKFIASIFGQTSILSWIVRLGAQVTEREQLIRVIAACALILQESPQVCGNTIGKCPAESVIHYAEIMQLSEITDQMQQMSDNEGFETRESLLSTFPQDWQQPVDPCALMPDVSEGYKTIVYALEIRIGRIIWNAAKQNFIEHARGGESYPDSLIVQYLLPCYISLLLDVDKYPDTVKNVIKKKNMYNVINGIVSFYEKTYHKWLRDSRPRNPMPSHPIPSFNPEEMRQKRTLASYYLESASLALHGYAGLGRLGFNSDPLTGFHIIALNMLDYPMFESVKDVKSKIEIYNCQTWLRDIYPHTQLLHIITGHNLKLPSPEMPLCHPGLSELYLASCVVHQLEVLASINQSYYPELLDDESDEYFEYSEALRVWRYTLFCIIFETEYQATKIPQQLLENFIKAEGQVLILKVFNSIKSLRHKLKHYNKKVHKLEISSVNQNVFKKYNDMFFSNNLKSAKLFEKEEVDKKYVKRRRLGVHGIECGSCGKKETPSREFRACQLCSQKEMTYFCSCSCRLKSWQESHLEQDLVSKIGLCDL